MGVILFGIYIVLSIVLTVIGVFISNIIFFDSILLAALSGLLCHTLWTVHPAFLSADRYCRVPAAVLVAAYGRRLLDYRRHDVPVVVGSVWCAGIFYIRAFFGFGEVDCSFDKMDLRQWIENRVFPIACDMFGNEFVISVNEADYGSVYFADHEKGYKKSLIGADLKQFIAKCKSKKIAPDTKLSIEEREADLISRGRGHVIDDLLRQMWQEEIDKYGNMVKEKVVIED